MKTYDKGCLYHVVTYRFTTYQDARQVRLVDGQQIFYEYHPLSCDPHGRFTIQGEPRTRARRVIQRMTRVVMVTTGPLEVDQRDAPCTGPLVEALTGIFCSIR